MKHLVYISFTCITIFGKTLRTTIHSTNELETPSESRISAHTVEEVKIENETASKFHQSKKLTNSPEKSTMTQPQEEKYSIWCVPVDTNYQEKLGNVIKDLAQQYDAPSFPPHITLLGGVTRSDLDKLKNENFGSDVLPNSKVLAALKTMPEHYDKWSQHFLLIVDNMSELQQLHDKVCEILQRPSGFAAPSQQAHLSLMYAVPGKSEGVPDDSTKNNVALAISNALGHTDKVALTDQIQWRLKVMSTKVTMAPEKNVPTIDSFDNWVEIPW